MRFERLPKVVNILITEMGIEFSGFTVSAFIKSHGSEVSVVLNEERSFKEGACGSSLKNGKLTI